MKPADDDDRNRALISLRGISKVFVTDEVETHALAQINLDIAKGDPIAVVVETRWEGVLNVPLGRLQPGDSMVAHICMIFTLEDGRIIAQKNYDCYEDFAAAA